MVEATAWGLIGSGTIGGEIRQRLAEPGTAKRLGLSALPSFVMRSSGVYDAEGNLLAAETLEDLDSLPGVIFVATPTTDSGEPTHEYITTALTRGSRVVTAEKGAVANFFPQLQEQSGSFRRLGIGATVGGGTRLLRQAREYAQDREGVEYIHLALNGTLAAVFGDMADGATLEAAAARAVRLGYAEPGSTSVLDVIRGEAEGDVPKKVGILFNYLGLSDKFFDWTTIRFRLTNDDILRAVADAGKRRFVVSIYPQTNDTAYEQTQGIIGGFRAEHDGWRIVGGFQDVASNPALTELTNGKEPASGFVIGLGPDGRLGTYSLKGPGAGAGPTVGTMLSDYAHIRNSV